MLILGLFGLKQFFKLHKEQGYFIAGYFCFALGLASLVPWFGQMCYGPRLMLYILPIASLPALYILNEFIQFPKKRILLKIVVLITLGVSCFYQIKVNTYHYFAFYKTHSVLQKESNQSFDRRINEYLFKTPFGKINRDLELFAKGKTPNRYLALYELYLGKEKADAVRKKVLHKILKRNYLLFR